MSVDVPPSSATEDELEAKVTVGAVSLSVMVKVTD